MNRRLNLATEPETRRSRVLVAFPAVDVLIANPASVIVSVLAK